VAAASNGEGALAAGEDKRASPTFQQAFAQGEMAFSPRPASSESASGVSSRAVGGCSAVHYEQVIAQRALDSARLSKVSNATAEYPHVGALIYQARLEHSFRLNTNAGART
jgi:hypothetical protein